MPTYTDHDFRDTIDQLRTLHSVQAPDRLKNRIQSLLISSLPAYPTHPSMLFSLTRLAFAFLFLMFAGGGSLVLAAFQSNEGHTLYPLKTAVLQLFSLDDTHEEEQNIDSFDVQPTATPTPTNVLYPTSQVSRKITPSVTKESPTQIRKTIQKEVKTLPEPTTIPSLPIPTVYMPSVTPEPIDTVYNNLLELGVEIGNTPVIKIGL